MAVTKISYYQDPAFNNMPHSARPFTQGSSFYVPNSYYTPEYVPPANYLKNYADPTELNSALDVLFNEQALNKMSVKDAKTPLPFGLDGVYNAALKFIQDNDEAGKFGWADVAQRAFGVVHLARTASYDPIAADFINPENKGFAKLSGFGPALLNTLQNFGETMDVLANPIKGMILDPDGPGKGFERAMGWGKDGRKNYDYDFDLGSEWLNKPLEVLAEVASDPFNWVSLGAWAAGKFAVSLGADAITQAVKMSAKEVGQELAEESAQQLAKQVANQIRKNPNDIAGTLDGVLNAASKPSFHKAAIEIARNDEFIEAFQRNVTEAVQASLNVNVLSGIRQFANTSNAIESAMLKTVGWTSGITPTWKALRLGLDPIAKAVHESGRVGLQGMIGPEGHIPLTQFEPAIAVVREHAKNLPADQVDDYAALMLDSIKVQAVEADMASIYKIVHGGGNTAAKLDAHFLTAIGKSFPDYVAYLQGLAERLPDFNYHFQELNAVKTLVDNQLMRKGAQSQLKIFRDAEGLIKGSYQMLANKAYFDNLSLSDLEKLTRRLQSMADTLSRYEGKPLYAKMVVALNDLRQAYNDVAQFGHGIVAQEIKSKDFQRPLKEVLKELTDETSLLRMALDEAEATARKSVLDTAYVRSLNEAHRAGADAPFDTLIQKLDADTFEELRGKVNPAFVKEQSAKVTTATEEYNKFVEKFGDGLQEFDYVFREIDDYYQDFLKSPETGTLEFRRFLDEWIDRIENGMNIEDAWNRWASRPMGTRRFDQAGDKAYEAFDTGAIDLLEHLRAIRSELDPLAEQLTDARTYNLLEQVTEYAFKESQAYAALRILDTEAGEMLQDISQQILQRSNIGSQIEQLKVIPELRDLVESIQGRASAHQIYTFMLNQMQKDPELTAIFPNIFDTLQTFKMEHIDNLYGGRGNFLQKFIDKVQSQFNAIESQGNSLDRILEGPKRAELKTEFAEFLKTHGLDATLAHDARHDVLKTMFLFTKQQFNLPAWQRIDQNKFLPVFYDIETTGLKEGSDQLLQISWRTMDGKHGNTMINLPDKLFPSHDVMAKLTGKTDPKEVMAEFTKRWHDGTLPTQDRAVQDFLDQLRQLELENNPAGAADVRKVMLVGWNNSRFDDPFLKDILYYSRARLPQTDVDFFDGLPSMDGLVELNRLQKVTQLTDKQTRAIRTYLTAYLENRHVAEQNWNGVRHFIDSIDGGFARDLTDIDRYLAEYANPSVGKLGTKIAPERDDVARLLRELGTTFGDTRAQLKDTADGIWEALSGIRRDNQALLKKRIFKDNETRAFMDASGKEIQIPGVLNTTQFMATRVGNLMQGAVKIMYNGDYVRRIFETLPEREVSRIARDQYYSFARSAVRLSDAVRNTDLATLHYDNFAAAAKKIQTLLVELYERSNLAMPAYFRTIDPAVTGTFDRFAIAQQLYDKLKYIANTRGYGTEMKKLLAEDKKLEDVFKILRRPAPMFNKHGAIQRGDEFTSTFFALKKQALYENGEEYIKQMYDDTTRSLSERLDQMGLIRDRKHMGNASSQAGYAILQKFKASWDNLMHYLVNKIPDDEIPAHAAETEGYLLDYINNLSISNLEWLAKMEKDKLEKYLWMANGRVTFATPTYVSEEYRAFMRGIYDTFLARAEELKANKLHVYFDEGAERMWIWMDNDAANIQKWADLELKIYRESAKEVLEFNKKVKRAQDKKHIPDWYAEFYQDLKPYFASDTRLPEVVRQSYEDMRDLTADLTRGKNLGTLGDMISRETMQEIDDFAPTAIRNQFIPLEAFAEAYHFDSFSFNRTNLGLPSARRQITNYVSGNIIKGYVNSAQSLVDVMDARTKLMYMFFDQNHSLGSGFFKDMTAEEMFEMLKKHPELKLAGLVDDPKYGAMVQEFSLWNVEDLRYWMTRADLNITIMPTHTFLQAHKAINDFKVGGSLMQALNHWVIGPMKTGYLTSLGFIFRNIVDSLVKNLLLAGDPEESFGMVKHTLETSKYYRRYKHIIQEMQEYNDGTVRNVHGMFSKRVVDRMYEMDGDRLNKLMSRDLFQLIHDFVEQGPSAGLSKFQQDAINLKMKTNRLHRGMPEPKKDLADMMMGNPLTQGVMSANSDIEQVFRLSGYTWALKEGRTTDQAMQAVLKHHFDYSVKSKAQMYAEYVVPFSSFTMNNTKFWMDALDRHGWMAGLYRDFYTPYWDFDQRDNEELSRNRSIQYHILAGNLIFDNNLVLKLSPSVMDAVRLLTDPEEILGRVAAYFRIPLDMLVNGVETDEYGNKRDWFRIIATNLPMIGPALYRYWPDDGSARKATGRIKGAGLERFISEFLTFYMPSLFGAVPEYEDDGYTYAGKKPRKQYTSRYYPTRTFTKRPPSARKAWVRRAYARKKYPRKTYARKSYAKRGYFRGVYAAKSTFRGTYVPRGQNTQQVMAKVLSTARGKQMRMPGAGSTLRNPTPGLYRKIYTGTGRSRFLSRMVPVTAQNLAARLRSDWAYLR